jgi:hypothetical protein
LVVNTPYYCCLIGTVRHLFGSQQTIGIVSASIRLNTSLWGGGNQVPKSMEIRKIGMPSCESLNRINSILVIHADQKNLYPHHLPPFASRGLSVISHGEMQNHSRHDRMLRVQAIGRLNNYNRMYMSPQQRITMHTYHGDRQKPTLSRLATRCRHIGILRPDLFVKHEY